MAHNNYMTTTTSTKVLYVGDSRGDRGKIRNLLTNRYGPGTTVRFVQCADHESGTERARNGHAWAKGGYIILSWPDIAAEWPEWA